MMKEIFNLNVTLYLLLILFAVYFGIEKFNELRLKRNMIEATTDNIHTDRQKFVSTLVGDDLTGKRVVITFRGQPKPTVVYAFSPVCHFCEQNEATLSAVYEAAKETHRFIGVATFTGGLKQYIEQKKLKFPVITNPQRGTGNDAPDGSCWGRWQIAAELDRSP
jgi:hypothetical protein